MKYWPETIRAIRDFQKGFLPTPDGRIDPGGTTWKKLVAAAGELGRGRSLLLSFDDGPEPANALDAILGTPGSIKAEFYVLGKDVKRSPDATKRISRFGHRVQSHSFTHKRLDTASKTDVLASLKNTQDIVKATVGVAPSKVRPPYGAGGQ